ncbi:MAG: site-specific DNA-methyltransferase, partial [Spirochaetes bacterium]|nr:site-specific DNA-methyltransferase [Spirochaetota bacterium]
FTVEGKLNPEELKKIIDPDLVKETERFEFKWFGKSEAKRNAFTPSKATLVYDEERSVNPEYADGNMIIEGENLESLKCLLSAYREQVKCIYIDPPYNTGKDFVYSDKWNESIETYWEHIGITSEGIRVDSNGETNGRFHSNWLNLIFSRLLIARQLLCDTGIIFISIDSNEVHHLRKVCDEVFGETNFIGCISRSTGTPTGGGFEILVNEIDYLLVYSKSELVKIKGLPFNENDEVIYDQEDENGKYLTRPLRRTGGEDRREDRPSMFFEVEAPNGDKIVPLGPTGYESRWICGKDKYKELLDNKLIEWKKVKKNGDEKWQVYQKFYLDGRTKQPSNLWDDLEGNKKATRDIRDLFDTKKVFDSPKPVDLIRRIIQLVPFENSDIILDFFAGSGTTAHACLNVNKADGVQRRFVLIQVPEKISEEKEAYQAGFNKISDITIERNKRVIQKIEKEESEKQPDLLTQDKPSFITGFKVYKLAKSNFPRIDFAPDPVKTEEENLALLNKYIEEKEAMFLAMIDEKNIFDEVLLKNGFMLNYFKTQEVSFSKNNVFRIKDNFKECLICMDMTIEKQTLKDLEAHKESIFICLERSLDTTMKWNLKHLLGEKLIVF